MDTTKKAYELAYNYEKDFSGCGQCVLAAIEDLFNLDTSVFRVGSVLGAGLCTTGTGPCGALIGGLMAIGYFYGRDRSDFDKIEPLRRSCEYGRRYIEKFLSEYGSYICVDIQTKIMGKGFNILDAQDFSAFEEAGGHDDKCTHVVGKAAEWAAELLLTFEKEELNL